MCNKYLKMNYKRQSHDGKYVCGLPTVKACYIFAIVNIVVVSLSILGLLGWLGLLVYLAVTIGVGWLDNTGIVITAFVTAGGYLATAIAAIFSILLLVGLRKKIPTLVKAYLIYGLVVETLMILATLVFIAFKFNQVFRGDGCAIYAAIVLCICVLYGFVLRVVMDTYVVLRHGHRVRANRTDVQALLYMLGTDGELQVLPLAR